VSAVRECPVPCYSKVYGFGAEEQGFIVGLTFPSCLASLLRWKRANTAFVVGLLSSDYEVWRYSLTIALHMSLLSTPSTVYQSPSPRMIGRSLRCAFGDGGWQVRGVDVEEKGCEDESLWDAKLEASEPTPSAVSSGKGEATITNQPHDQADHASSR